VGQPDTSTGEDLIGATLQRPAFISPDKDDGLDNNEVNSQRGHKGVHLIELSFAPDSVIDDFAKG